MKLHAAEVIRYTTNGAFATGVHYSVLYTSVEILNFRPIGVANLLASGFGILASFVGNKYYVFRSSGKQVRAQLIKFLFFYALVAFAHGTFLYQWSDVFNLNYNYGFILAVIIQFLLGYLGAKHLVFNKPYRAPRS